MPQFFKSLSIVVLFCGGLLANANQKILVIGDSQTAGHLGEEFHSYFSTKTSKKNLNVWGVGGSSPHHWGAKSSEPFGSWLCSQKGRHNLKTRTDMNGTLCGLLSKDKVFNQLIRKNNPDHVVFQFLGNSVGFSEQEIKTHVDVLFQSLPPGASCTFVSSPPVYHLRAEQNKKRVETQDKLKRAVGERCLFISGINQKTLTEFSKDRSNYVEDEVHLSKSGAAKFMAAIKEQLEPLDEEEVGPAFDPGPSKH